ncbi:MAG TPA: hypothetical protein VLS96_07670 [Nodosilinea sp.]|nr:hypothetical protein [Nodosilinea sp.]
MMISTLRAGLVGAMALAALAPFAPAALAGVAVSTDRVQVQVGNNGQVYIRTLADGPQGSVFNPRPGVLPQAIGPGSNLRLPTTNFAPGCTARSQVAHSTRSTPAGNVIYSENRSTTRVCP